jgi:hypothetical protein
VVVTTKETEVATERAAGGDDGLVVEKRGVKAKASAYLLPPGHVVIPADDGQNCAQDRQDPPDGLRDSIWAF